MWLSACGVEARLRVAVLFDGPGWYFEELWTSVQRETEALTTEQVEFVLADRFNADWQADAIAPMLDKALADPEIDLIFAAGLLTAEEAARPERALTKPVLAGFSQDAALSTFRAKENFSFVISRERVTRDVAKMQRLFEMDTLYAMLDASLIERLAGVEELAQRLETELGLPVELLPVRADPEEALASVPETAQAVYITPLFRMDDPARQELFAALAERGVFTFAMLGATDVDQGALAGLTPETHPRLARRLALNLVALLEGRSATHLPTEFSMPEQLVMNEETMQKAGFSPSMGILLEARTVRDPAAKQPRGETLTLHDALARALLNNVRLDRIRAELAAAKQDRYQARSALFPQIDGQAMYLEIDRDRAAASFGLEARSRATGGARARQVLFSDEVFSRLRAATRGVARADWEAEEARLDIVQETAERFFDALTATALLEVERDQLTRIRENLELARLRVNIGQTGPEDAWRWESEEARQLASMLAAEARMEAARAALNQSLGETPGTSWQLEAVKLADAETYFLDEELRFATSDVGVILELMAFWQEWALQRSPALKALDEARAARGLLADAKRRSRYLPTVGVQAGYDHVFDRRTAGPDLGAGLAQLGAPIAAPDLPDNEWNVAVVAEIPLFDGGRRRAVAARARADQHELDALHREAREQTELAVISTYQQVLATQPAIRLSRQRARAARNSLELIQDRYEEGTAGILDLLDVQGRAFAADQEAVIAVNRYLQDLTRFQRAIAWFAWTEPELKRQELVAAVKAYLEDN